MRRRARSIPSASWSRSPASTAPPARKGKLSDYATQLREKQKVKRIYGLLERQFRNYYKKASTQEGQHRRKPAAAARDAAWTTSSTAWASRSPAPAARQLVSHRGVTVNGKTVNLPSYQVKAGDAIALSERAQKQLRVQESLTVSRRWICRRPGSKSTRRSSPACSRRVPDRADLPADINEALIVELYSK